MKKISPLDTANLLRSLRHNQATQHLHGDDLDPQMRLLRAWQADRLTKTYADLLAIKRYTPACHFFLEDVYAPRDFLQRDHELEQMHQFSLRFLPASLLRPLTHAIELNSLTRELDAKLLSVLVNQLDMQETLTESLYTQGYRLCDNYADRARQIEMIIRVGSDVDRLVRLPFVGTTLRMARNPARHGGWIEVQGFLERGFAAFKHMRGAKEFLQKIKQRETQILDQIYSESAQPFQL